MLRLSTIMFTLTCLLPLSAMAEVPQQINYQGRLADADDIAVDTTADLTFSIFSDEGGTDMLWTETHTDVVVENGLFSAMLGRDVSFPGSLFDGQTRYLGVQVDYGPMPTDLVAIVSTAYTIHAGSADTAAYALAAPNGSANGWVDDGGAIRLENAGDNVGIGTASPTTKLDVDGNIHTSGNLTVGGYISDIHLGDPTESGTMLIHRNGVSTEVASFGSSSHGGRLILYDETDHALCGLYGDIHGTGGTFYLKRNLTATGFSVDGNYSSTNEPRVSIWGSDRSALFRMDQSGDESVVLPDSSISATEMLNEPGIAFAGNSTDSIEVNLMWDTVVESLTVTLPEAGYVYVQAHCCAKFRFVHTHQQGVVVNIVDSVESGSPTYSQPAWVFLQGLTPPQTRFHMLSVSMVYYKPAGSHLFKLKGSNADGGGPVTKIFGANMSAIYLPTSYGSVLTTTTAGNVANFENAELIPPSGLSVVHAEPGSSGPLYKVDLRELELRAARARAEAERAERELLEAQLQRQEGLTD